MPAGFRIFEDFEDEKYVHLDDLPHMVNYICGNLNSDYCPNCKYWYSQYSYSSKRILFGGWDSRKASHPLQNGEKQFAKIELANYFKEHKDCSRSCGSVYYK